MFTQELKDKIVWAYEEAWLKGNVDAIDEIFAPDIVMHIYPFPDISGLAMAKQGLYAQLQAFSDLHWDSEEIIKEGNTMVWRYTIHVKHTGSSPALPVPPTGRELAYKGCDVFHIDNDKVKEIFAYRDYLGMSATWYYSQEIGNSKSKNKTAFEILPRSY
jgi:predicted ester cyclase